MPDKTDSTKKTISTIDENCVPAQDFPTTRCDLLARTLAFLLLRFWLAVRAIATGLDKFSAPRRHVSENLETGEMSVRVVKEYALENYVGVPVPQFEALLGNPIFPEWLLHAFAFILGPVLILLGVMLLLGIFTRSALFALGGIFVLLTLGLSFLETVGSSVLGIHVVIAATALTLSRYNKFSLTKRF